MIQFKQPNWDLPIPFWYFTRKWPCQIKIICFETTWLLLIAKRPFNERDLLSQYTFSRFMATVRGDRISIIVKMLKKTFHIFLERWNDGKKHCWLFFFCWKDRFPRFLKLRLWNSFPLYLSNPSKKGWGSFELLVSFDRISVISVCRNWLRYINLWKDLQPFFNVFEYFSEKKTLQTSIDKMMSILVR